ncbi:hypothetical protein Tco_1450501 [Tanacetum coccineum]
MNSLDKNSIARGDILNSLNGVTEALKAIQDDVKENPTLHKKVIEATEAYTKNLNDLLTLIKNFDFQGLKSSVTFPQTVATSQDKRLAELAKSISPLKVDTEEPLSYTEGEHADMEEEPTNAVLITTVKPTEILTFEAQPITTIISTSQPEPSVPQREGKGIVTDDQPKVQRKLVPASKEIQAHMDKEEQIKKAAKEAIMFEMTKTEVIKVVQEEAKKIGLHSKKIISVKAGEKFKKTQDVEHQVLKIEHSQKAKRAMKLKKKRVEQYMWTMSNRLKPEPNTDVKIHPKTKPVVITVYRNNDKKNFDVHNPFKFIDFGITELDELGPIIEKKKNTIIKDLMEYLSKIYERLKKIPEELRIQSALPPVPEQAPSVSSGRKRNDMELEPEIKVPGNAIEVFLMVFHL